MTDCPCCIELRGIIEEMHGIIVRERILRREQADDYTCALMPTVEAGLRLKDLLRQALALIPESPLKREIEECVR